LAERLALLEAPVVALVSSLLFLGYLAGALEALGVEQSPLLQLVELAGSS
jgi:hypothetical protein